ncbi:hypothetical protein [Deinococcus hohokamensis]|uniref:Integrase n=1 Tax=Deinococcus hohokamensis TaxID=309883 RepID=A0ABV9I918_9DEIO
MTDPFLDQALTLRALRQGDLDSLFPHVKDHLRIRSDHAWRLLSPFFDAARAEHRSLEGFDADFHEFLHRVAGQKRNGDRAAPNTIRTRLGAMSALYTYLQDTGVLSAHPMRGIHRPAKTLRAAPAPDRSAVAQLHRQTRATPDLHAALILIDEHAMNVTELLSLTWGHLNLPRGELARRAGPTRLSPAAEAALKPLYEAQGGFMTDDHAIDLRRRVFPWRQETELRAAIMQACRAAPLPYLSPAELRRAGLRDHPHTPESAGYAREDGARQLARATRLAREVAEQLGAPEEGQEKSNGREKRQADA